MKTFIYIKGLRHVMMFAVVLLSVVTSWSCLDGDDKGAYVSFEGKMIAEYLDEYPETYSEFSNLLEVADLKNILNAYGTYTCFAPTNEAMQVYKQELGISSFEELSKEEIDYLIFSHIVETKYLTSELNTGSAILNMNSRYLSVIFSGSDIYINTESKVTKRNIEVHNGVIQQLNKVLLPSNSQLPDLIAENSDLSIFHEALELTGWSNQMRMLEDSVYLEVTSKEYLDDDLSYKVPAQRKYGYTALVETNQVFAAANIFTIDDLKQYVAEVYDPVFPDDASVTDVTDSRNSLNRFVAYHLLDCRVAYDKFLYSWNNVPGFDVYNYFETFANLLVEVSNVSGSEGELYINKYNISDNVYGGTIITSPELSGKDQSALNGVYHYINKILVYDKTVRDVVLNKRLRIDVASLLPELITNELRGDQKTRYGLAPGYFKNIEASPECNLRYLASTTWSNYQSDELMVVGQYDFTLRLPPVPQGNYEIRIGYTANQYRGIAQIYLGTVSEGLPPIGIPLDMRILGDAPKVGWVADKNTLDNGVENDKMMRNRGYMKAPDSFMSAGANPVTIGRDHNGSLRRIITTKDLYPGEPYYIRFKSVIESVNTQFHFDYIEFVPKTVYADPKGENRH